MSETIQPIGSILAVDFGSVYTRALLFDLVDGEYRLVARGKSRTTVGFPIDDVNIGVGRILRDISEATGRRFFNDENTLIKPERDDRSGVDYYITTASAGRPMRVVIIGLIPDISITSALRAMAGSYVEPVATIHLDDGLDEEDRINQIILNRPDLLFIAGGTDGGAKSALIELFSIIQLAIALIPERLRPTILYAGNNELADTLKQRLGDLTQVLIAPNIRPTETTEELEPARIMLGRAYDEHKEKQGFSFRNVAPMSSSGILPTAQSSATITEFFAQSMRINVISVDVGSATSVLTASIKKSINTSIRTDIGLGQSAASLVQTVGVGAIESWLPFYPDTDEITNYALNKSLRPAGIPMDLREMYLEHALVRAGIQRMLTQARIDFDNLPAYGDMPHFDMIIGAGSCLTGTGYRALDMLLMVDALQPTGVTHVKADPYGVIPALGALALREPAAVIQLINNNVVEHLGSVISVSGTPRTDSWAIRLKITTEDGEEFEHEINGGNLWHLPLPANVSLNAEIKVARGLSIGGERTITLTLEGGSAGVLFDARGRSLTMGQSVEERADNMPRWFAQVTDAEEPIAIPQEWLIPPEPPAEVVEEVKSSSKKRRGKKEEVKETASIDERMSAFGDDELDDEDFDMSDDDDDLDTLFEDDDDDDDDFAARIR